MSEKKRKVLIITFLWPPLKNVGVMRIAKFAKYLPQFGWDPIVLTVKENKEEDNDLCEFILSKKIEVIKTEYVDIVKSMLCLKNMCGTRNNSLVNRYEFDKKNIKLGRILSRINKIGREALTIPDGAIGWYRDAVKTGLEIINEKNIDLIFSTAPPETTYLIARSLKRKTGLPWVADMRDLWSLDHYRQRSCLKKRLLSFMERYILKQADALTIVSELWANEERRLCGYLKNKIFIVSNGYDPDDYIKISVKPYTKFTMVYTGKLHKRYQDPEIIYKVLSNLIKNRAVDKKKISIKFYLTGFEKPDISGLSSKYSLEDVIRLYDPVDYKESLAVQKAASVLLLFQWNGSGGEGWHSAKVFEYIGSQKPILLVNANPGGELARLIKETNTGFITKDYDDLEHSIMCLYREFYKMGKILDCGNKERVLEYTRERLTNKLVSVFSSVIS